MSGKDCLQQIQVMDIRIKQKMDQLEDMKRMRTYLRGACIGSGSKSGNMSDGFSKMSDKLIDLERTLNQEIEAYQLMKNEQINRIQSLSKPEYMEVLYKRYVEYKTVERISYEMNYTYKYTSRLIANAVKEFEKQNTTKDENIKNKCAKMVS